MNKYKIPVSYYEEQKPIMKELSEKANEKTLSLWQHILLVSSSIDGVLISLHTESPSYLYIRLVFLLSVFLLSVGVSCSAIVLFDLTALHERARQEFLHEYEKAIQDDRKLKPVYVGYKKRTLICQKTSYWCFALSMLLLLTYTIMRELLWDYTLTRIFPPQKYINPW